MRQLIPSPFIFILSHVTPVSVLAGAGGGPPPKYFVDQSTLPFTPLPGASAHWGTDGKAGHRIEGPDAWNGRLVMWAHGLYSIKANRVLRNK